MSSVGLSLVVGAVTFVLVGIWYLQANRTWTGLLRHDDPTLAYDPVRDPVGWAAGGPRRVGVWLRLLRHRDARPAVEHWRVRTINRFEVWIALALLGFLAGGQLAGYLVGFVRTSIEKYPSGFGVVLVIVIGFMLGYYGLRLGRTLHEYGNARRPSSFEVLVPIAGLVVTLVAMAILPNLDLSKP